MSEFADIELAVRLEANDDGIFDEEIIKKMIEDYKENNYFDEIEEEEIWENNFVQESTTNFETSLNLLNILESLNIQINQEPLQNPLTVFNIVESFTTQINQQILPPYVFIQNHPQVLNPFSFQNIFQMNNNMFSEKVSVTLSEKALKSLKEVKYEEIKNIVKNFDSDENCSICLCTLTEDTSLHKYMILPCNHVFHSECIKEWLMNHDYHCPICKRECGEHVANI